MSTHYWGTDDNKFAISYIDPPEWNHFARKAESAATGALLLLGAGVASETALRVSLVGSDVHIAPGDALLVHSVHGPAFVSQETIGAVDASEVWPDDGAVYVMALMQVATPYVSGSNLPDPDEPDTRENRSALFVLHEDGILDGAIPLARLTLAGGMVTNIEDVRPRLNEGSDLLRRLYGNGRIVGLDRTIGAPTREAGTLFVQLPAASYVWQGRFYDAAPLSIEAPASFDGWAIVSFDDDGLPRVLSGDWRTAQPPAGSGILARVKTNATEITELLLDDADVIEPEWVRAAHHQSVLQRLAALESGGGTGGTGGGDNSALVLAIAALQKRLDDQDAIIAELSRKLGGDAPTVLRVAGENEVLRGELQRVLASQTHDNAFLAGELEAAIVAPGVAGNNETLPDGTHSPDFYIGGSWKPVPRKRQFN